MRIGVILPAAGQSRRFEGGDKLAQDLGGRALLLRTVEALTKREEVVRIVVAGPPDDEGAFREKFAAVLGFHGATVVDGGRAERWETVRNALAAIADEECSHIAVHDAARPGVSNDLLSRIFTAARSLSAVVPAVPIAGTVKRGGEVESIGDADEDGLADAILGDAGRMTVETRPVLETVDRTGLFEVQTPQVFEASLLRRAYQQSDLAGATDDAMLVERLGEPVHLVPGERRNLKVTTRDDLDMMRAILGVKPPPERPAHMRF